MRLNEVINRFSLVSGLEPSEVTKWTPVCIDAMNEIKSKALPEALENEADMLRLSACAGALAYYRYCMYKNEDRTKQFTAGAVSVTMENTNTEKAHKLWEFERKSVEDLLVSTEDFCFRRVSL